MSVDNRIAALTANLVVVSFYDAPYYNLTTSSGLVANPDGPMNQRRLVWSRPARYEADHMAHVVARLSPTSAALLYPGDTPFSSSSQSRWSQDEQAAAPLTARIVTVAVNTTSGRPVIRGLSKPATLRLSDVDGPFDCTGVSASQPARSNSTAGSDHLAPGTQDRGPTGSTSEHGGTTQGRRMRSGNVHKRAETGRWSAASESRASASARQPSGLFRGAQQLPSVVCAFSDLTTGSLRTVLLQEQRQTAGPASTAAGSSLPTPHFTAMATVLEHASVSAGSNSAWRDLSVARMSETGAAVLFSDDAHGGRAVASLVGVSTLASRPSLVVSESRFDLTDRNPDPANTLFWAGIATLGDNAVMLVDWASLETPQRGSIAGSIFGSQLAGLQRGPFTGAQLGDQAGIHTRSDGTTVSLGGRISVIMAGGVPAGVSTGGGALTGEDVVVKVGGVAKLAIDTTAVGGCAGAHAHTAYAVPDGSVVVGSGNRLSALAHADHRWGVATAVTDPADGTSTSVLVASQSALGFILDCEDDQASVLLRPGGGFH